jgi:hypothetical protein
MRAPVNPCAAAFRESKTQAAVTSRKRYRRIRGVKGRRRLMFT